MSEDTRIFKINCTKSTQADIWKEKHKTEASEDFEKRLLLECDHWEDAQFKRETMQAMHKAFPDLKRRQT